MKKETKRWLKYVFYYTIAFIGALILTLGTYMFIILPSDYDTWLPSEIHNYTISSVGIFIIGFFLMCLGAVHIGYMRGYDSVNNKSQTIK